MQIYLINRNKYKDVVKMGGPRNRFQMKEQENSTEELDGMEASNLSDREIRVMIIRMLNSMKKRHRKHKKRTSQK